MAPWPFAGGQDFLDNLAGLDPGCILLDMRMPKVDGIAVLTQLAESGVHWPVIAMTGHGDVALAVNAMKLGALDFLEKPMEEDVLGDVLDRAFAKLSEATAHRGKIEAARERIAKLTSRETAVLRGIVGGRANKTIAANLGISVRTVEMHRENLIKKLGVKNGAEAAAYAVESGMSAS